jgi:pentatricopeptide repeat protein
VSAKAINKHVKPSIEVINGAITALVRSTDKRLSHQKRVEHVQKLLAWAGGFSIKPDAVTYNALIQLYIRASEHSTAFKILRQMEREGIEADVATHTMLINSSFDNGAFDGLSHAQQTEKIISMLDGLKAAGLKLNDYIYSAAIDRLLKNYSNFTAVRQLTEHMKAHKLVPSKYVYTSLITHYFQQDPPEIAAVDTLVNQIFTAHRIIADHVLLDRTLEGYAAADEIGKMMSVLTRMSKQGRQPGWYALTAVIQALVRDGDYDRARSIVRDVRFGDKAERWGLQGGSDQENRFFYQAKILGVYDDDGPANKMPGFGSGSSSSEFTMSKKAIRSSRDEKALGEQPRQQEIEQRTREEKVQDGLEELTRASQSAAEKQQNEDVLQEEVQGELEQPASDSRPAARDQQEEDIHDFLRDDHEDIHSRVNKQ